MKKIKVAFIIPSLTSGGAERILAFLSQEIDFNEFETTLISLGKESQNRYDVSKTKVIYLNQERILTSVPALFRLLRKERFDVVLGAIRHLNALLGFLSVFFSKTKFVGRETNVMSVRDKYQQEGSKDYPDLVYKWGYRYLDGVVCQSQDMLKDLSEEFPAYKQKFRLIHNPITSSFVPKKEKTPSTPPYKLITVGSLEPRKGHLRILEGLANIEFDFEYTLIGKGSMLTEIENKAQLLKLDSRLKFIPYTNEVRKHLEQSNVFIQGSYVEGFPNALLESCAVGTPVIAFDAPGGINEIIENGINGFIVRQPDELPNRLQEILNSNQFTPEVVSKSVFEKYGAETILKRYEELFREVNETTK